MRSSIFSSLCVLIHLFVTVLGTPSVSPKTLVVYDSKLTDLTNYSKLFNYLQQDESIELDYAQVNETFQLFKNGVRVYQNLILFPTRLRVLGHDINASKLLEFINDGGDVLTITSPDALGESVRSFANQLGIYPSPKSHKLIDHFQFDPSQDSHYSILLNSSNVVPNPIVSIDEQLSYHGSSALLKNSPQLIPIIQAPTTSFTKDVKNDDITENNWTVGKQGYLVVGHQALNNARSLWIGDDSIFQDLKFDQNAKFTQDLFKWVTQSKNVIKVTQVEHSHVDGTSYEETPYKIKDDIIYKIGLTQWDSENAKWVPYVADDVQLEVKLLDPYHRLTLTALETLEDSTIYGVEFKLPDHHGVFSFHTDYKRPGFTYIDEKNILSIRHLANDEYPRSWEIPNSWVYITSSVVVFIGWFIFVLTFIYSKESTTKKETKKDK